MIDIVQLFLTGLAAISIYMTVVWLLSLLIRNAGIVDVAWSFGFTVLAALYAFLTMPPSSTNVLLIAMYVVSSLRLTWHLLSRFLRWYPKEDPRYGELREKMGKSANAKMLLVFLFQGAVLAVFSIPLVISLAMAREDIDFLVIVALLLWVVAMLGEAVADLQLAEFVRDAKNRNSTCQVGLWRYSRHPNYFFEWLTSVSFALYVSGLEFGLIAWVSPALLLFLLFYVTGIKPSEEHSLKSRPDYADYVKRTSVFVPWPRRNPS